MTLLGEQIPAQHRAGGEGGGQDAELGQAGIQFGGRGACGPQTREIPLHIRQEHGHPQPGESLRHHLQGHRLAGPGGTGDETVAIGQGR
ncbi:hypothetical protein D3C80_1252750 [compost metagenome]